jgi:serine/threonine protein kinase
MTANCWKCKTPIDANARNAGRCPKCSSPVSRVVRPPVPRTEVPATVVPDADEPAPIASRTAETIRWDEVSTSRSAPTVLPAPPLDTQQRESAANAGSLRRYPDGTLVTADGVEVPSGQAAITLPHRRSDVRFRIGSYDVLSELGRGGMGVVFRAYSLKLCRPVAIKMMTSGRFADEAEVIRFQNEAMLAARLEHPHIVQVYDAGEHDGNLFFVMAMVDGHSFGKFVDLQLESTTPADRNALLMRGIRVLSRAARALDYAHRRGIIHRDVKPDNILVDKDDEPHLTDFGIAKNVQREFSLTKPGAIIGTPAYMAPEQGNNITERIGPSADVYSLGATLYHLATGRAPFEGPNPLAVLIAVMQKDPDPPKTIAKKILSRDLPEDLATIILKSMEKRAADRYDSAKAFADDLDLFLEDKPISARNVSATERFRKLVRRNRAAFAMTAAAFLILIFMAVGFGMTLAFNLGRTSNSLRAQDMQAALDQASTLERAIVANMVEGRADVVRKVVDKLRTDPKLTRVEVVRTDKTLAYTDSGTRDIVGKRILDEKTRASILAANPKFDRKLEMVEKVAFVDIDEAKKPETAPTITFDGIDDKAWRELLDTRETMTRTEVIDGVPHLTVLKPIPNGKTCQLCHGPALDPTARNEGLTETVNPYDTMYSADPKNMTRAVLVVRRSQQALEDQISNNTRDTLLIGGGTTFGFLAVLFLAVKLLGVRLKPQRFG